MKQESEFDVVVWGASGFTGRLAAEKLAARAGSDLRWAIGGRNRAKLEDVHAGLGPAAAEIPIIIGDSSFRQLSLGTLELAVPGRELKRTESFSSRGADNLPVRRIA